MSDFAKLFQVITGVSMDRAIKASIDGKEQEILNEINENCKRFSESPLRAAVEEMKASQAITDAPAKQQPAPTV